jgi:hypothetical protein
VERLPFVMTRTQVCVTILPTHVDSYRCLSTVCAVEYCTGPPTLGSCISAGPGIFKVLDIPVRNICCSYQNPKQCFNDYVAAHKNTTETVEVTITTYTTYVQPFELYPVGYLIYTDIAVVLQSLCLQLVRQSTLQHHSLPIPFSRAPLQALYRLHPLLLLLLLLLKQQTLLQLLV